MSPWRMFGATLPWKATLNVVAVIGIGIGVGKHLEQAADTRTRVLTVEQDATTLKADVKAIRLLMKQQVCLTLAERQHTDWRKCIDVEEAK